MASASDHLLEIVGFHLSTANFLQFIELNALFMVVRAVFWRNRKGSQSCVRHTKTAGHNGIMKVCCGRPERATVCEFTQWTTVIASRGCSCRIGGVKLPAPQSPTA